MTKRPESSSPLQRLARLTRPRFSQERCDLCGASIAPEHQHLLEIQTRQLQCACDACAVLFSGQEMQRYRRVPPRIQRLEEIEGIDGIWEGLPIPINLAFFYRSGESDKIVAMYPSPGGATESLLSLDTWSELTGQSAALRQMQSDIEALLINRVRDRRDCFLVSIDQCYKLVGLIRTNWRGISGGSEVWRVVEEFFEMLHQRAAAIKRAKGGVHA